MANTLIKRKHKLPVNNLNIQSEKRHGNYLLIISTHLDKFVLEWESNSTHLNAVRSIIVRKHRSRKTEQKHRSRKTVRKHRSRKKKKKTRKPCWLKKYYDKHYKYGSVPFIKKNSYVMVACTYGKRYNTQIYNTYASRIAGVSVYGSVEIYKINKNNQSVYFDPEELLQYLHKRQRKKAYNEIIRYCQERHRDTYELVLFIYHTK